MGMRVLYAMSGDVISPSSGVPAVFQASQKKLGTQAVIYNGKIVLAPDDLKYRKNWL